MSKERSGFAKFCEEEAVKHLRGLGYKILQTNFRYGKVGEIDVVAEDEGTLVFVEVKGRNNYNYGKPEESVGPRKQAQIKRVARMYYYVNALQDRGCRFDVIAIDQLFGKLELRHHKQVFF